MIPGLTDRRDEGLSLDRELQVTLRRVLIIDEAVPVRRKLLEILHRCGVAASVVQTAERADVALEIFARDHPNLIFTEFVGVDPKVGLAMIEEMLEMDPQARIVLITAEDPCCGVVRQAVRMGVFSVIEKPLRHDKIRAILAEIDSEEGGVERFR